MKGKFLGWSVVTLAGASLVLAAILEPGFVDLPQLLFWLALLIIADLLPVALGFGAQVSMAFPVLIAISILFPPSAAMVTAGLGAVDTREFRREIPLWRALFNRAQWILAVGTAS